MLKNRKPKTKDDWDYIETESGNLVDEKWEADTKPNRKIGFLNRIWNMMDKRIKK